MGKGSVTTDILPVVLGKRKHFPERRQGFPFVKGRNKNIDQQHKEIRREDAEDSFDIEFREWNLLPSLPGRHQLVRNQKTAEHKKQIHPAPSEMKKTIIHPARVLENSIVKKKNEADGQGTEMIQADECMFSLHESQSNRTILSLSLHSAGR